MDFGVAVDVGPGGDVFVAGWFASGNWDSTEGGPMALFRYSAAGERLWCQPFGTIGTVPTDVAADPTGGAVVSGYFTSSVDFGNGPLEGAQSVVVDAFLAKFPP